MVQYWMVVAIALGLWAPLWAEQPNPKSRRRSFLSNRVVQHFDFDERDDGNFERLPRYWFVVHAPGFPRHTADQTGFDDTQATSGKFSLMMKSNGGSAATILQKGAIAAIPGADYVVTAQIRTKDTAHARARLVGYFLDDAGQPIAASRDASELVNSPGEWQQVKIRLSGDHQDAAWIVLKMELLQAERFRRAKLGEHELYEQDVGATAWFDDVVIFQLPRIELSTQTDTNIIRQPSTPNFDITVRDLTGDHLAAELDVYDHVGRHIDSQKRTFDGRQSPQWKWSPKVAKLGWYWVDLRVTGDRGLVGRRAAAFVWLPELSSKGRAEAARFGVVCENGEPGLRVLLPEMIKALGVDAVLTDVWRESMSLDELGSIESQADPVIAKLIADRRRVSLSLSGVPAELAALNNCDPDKPMSLFEKDPEVWQSALRATLGRYGQNVNRWQIGSTGSDEAFWLESLQTWYPRISGRIAQLVPEAELALPWSVQLALPESFSPMAFNFQIPVSVRPDLIGGYLNGVKVANQAVVLDALDPEHFDHDQRVQDMALRLIEVWRAQPGEIYLRRPWNRGSSPRPTALPDPLAGVLANMVQMLGERRVVGQMDLAQGVHCYILDGRTGGALAVWTEGGEAGRVDLDLFLGDKPELVDVWGNRQPLDVQGGRHHLPIGRVPVFVEGIDAKLARFRAGLAFKPAFLESTLKEHALELMVTNPWSQNISGRLHIDGLPRWAINPRSIRLDVPANKTIAVPIAMTFPVSELAGEKHLTASMQLQADRSYDISVNMRLKIGLEDIEYQPTLSVRRGKSGGEDVVISALVNNRGDRDRSLYAFALAPDLPRQQRLIMKLGPGESTIKQFRFVGAAESLSGGQIRVGLREVNGSAAINQLLDVP